MGNFELVEDYRRHTVVVEAVGMAFDHRLQQRHMDIVAWVDIGEFVDMVVVETEACVGFGWETRDDYSSAAVDCRLGCRIYCADRPEERDYCSWYDDPDSNAADLTVDLIRYCLEPS